jgi:hypothetical protein
MEGCAVGIVKRMSFVILGVVFLVGRQQPVRAQPYQTCSVDHDYGCYDDCNQALSGPLPNDLCESACCSSWNGNTVDGSCTSSSACPPTQVDEILGYQCSGSCDAPSCGENGDPCQFDYNQDDGQCCPGLTCGGEDVCVPEDAPH